MRIALALCALAALVAVIVIIREPEPPAGRHAGPRGTVAAGPEAPASPAGGAGNDDAYTLASRAEDDEDLEVLDVEKIAKLFSQASVVLDLSGENGRPLRQVRGVIVDATGVVLTRYEPLLGAHRGTCRLSDPEQSRVEVTGLSFRNEALDIALVRISRSPVGYAMLPPLLDAPGEILGGGETLFLFMGARPIEARVEDPVHVSSDGVGRILVGRAAQPPSDVFAAVDTYGLLVGLCRAEVGGVLVSSLESLPSRGFRVVVDPLQVVADAVDRDAAISLFELTRRYYDGTFADLFHRGSVAYKRKLWREALPLLEQAADRVSVDLPPEKDVGLVRRYLRECYLEETRRLLAEDRAAEAEAIARTAVGRFSDDPALLLRLAEVEYAGEDWASGIEALLRARALGAQSHVDSLLEDGYLQLARAAARQSDTAGQEAALLDGIGAVPTSGKLQLELAKLYVDLGAYDDALRLLGRARDLAPSLGDAVDRLAARIDDILKQRDAVILPIDRNSRSIRAKATLNGIQELTFIVDTGATYTTIPPSVATALGYDLNAVGPEHTITLLTASGRVVAKRIQLQSLDVGGYSVRNLYVTVLPQFTSKPYGLLGLNFLKHFKYTVDASRGEFRIERP